MISRRLPCVRVGGLALICRRRALETVEEVVTAPSTRGDLSLSGARSQTAPKIGRQMRSPGLRRAWALCARAMPRASVYSRTMS
jgi:hypothetical protein